MNISSISRLFSKMKTVQLIVMSLALATAAEIKEIKQKKEKRGVTLFGPAGYDFLGVLPAFSASPWTPTGLVGSVWNSPASPDVPLSQLEIQATHNLALQALKSPIPGTPSIAYPPEVIKAVQQAKEANHNVIIAQNRVVEAKHAVVVQQRIALAKEAAAREAAARAQEISAHAQADARASARQLVALQQKLATLKDLVAAAQRVAAARETAAAAAIQRNASDTAAELRKQDVDKQINQSEREAKEKDVIAAKENAIANAVQLATDKPAYHPWG